MTEFLRFESRGAASNAVTDRIAQAARESLAGVGRTTIMLSGGSSPVAVCQQLSRIPLDWKRVHITLTDERVVDVTDERSNEKMVRENLMQGAASDARFERLTDDGSFNAFDAACGLVGMGEDGHFASLFPDLPALPDLLDAGQPPGIHRVKTVASDVERLSMNLSGLLSSQIILLLAFGDAKRSIIEKPTGFPVESLLNQRQVPVTVFWAG